VLRYYSGTPERLITDAAIRGNEFFNSLISSRMRTAANSSTADDAWVRLESHSNGLRNWRTGCLFISKETSATEVGHAGSKKAADTKFADLLLLRIAMLPTTSDVCESKRKGRARFV